MSEKDCIFCKIAKGEIESELVLEGDRFIAFKDVNPKVVGHTLIIPKKHFVTLFDIPKNWGEELLEFTKKVADEVMEGCDAHGFNLVMNNLEAAGQVVEHAHIHILPRKEGDGFKIVG